MKTNHIHHQSRQRNTKYIIITITGQSVEEHTLATQVLMIMSFKWTHISVHIFMSMSENCSVILKTVICSYLQFSLYLMLSCFQSSADLTNTCLKMKTAQRSWDHFFSLLLAFTLAFLCASDL